MTGKEANASEISQLLKTEFGITVENGVVEKELRTLDSGGDLILLGDKRYKISQRCQKALDKEIGESEDLERRVEQLFSDELSKNWSTCQKLWK